MSAFQISYCIAPAERILEQIGRQITHERTAGYLKVLHPTVTGRLYGRSIDPSLSVYGVSIEVHDAFQVARHGSGNKDLFILDFHLDAYARLLVENEDSRKLVIGAYLSSSDYESTAVYVPGAPAKFVSFIIHKRWLLEYIQISDAKLADLLEENQCFFFFREIGVRLAAEVGDAYTAIYSEEPVNASYLQGCAFKILSLFFASFVLEDESPSRFNREDLKAIEAVKKHLDTNPALKIEIKDLLEIAAMSESKFRGLFKSIVGSSPIDYHIHQKMWYAKSLIESGNQISNVVDAIGYTNHSYFTRTFKELFGLTPVKYREAIIQAKGG